MAALKPLVMSVALKARLAAQMAPLTPVRTRVAALGLEMPALQWEQLPATVPVVLWKIVSRY